MLVHDISRAGNDRAGEDSDEGDFEGELRVDDRDESGSLNSSVVENDLGQSKGISGMTGLQSDDSMFIGIGTPSNTRLS